ncbi:hypothetical protein PG913_07690 [Tenacibaculum pacificus]|uniref:OB-fold nucleic acid binding domain-containing protein n=1 Tax=Tenacibaculum pacificus TaxID=3018314 RepID=UPI0022F3A580|nr:hypothetical protein [Tenacibaculum pacificus]WBX72790.1 hypothetical protein PG913_07690 [Tenacibaculum pacificus]
MKYFTVIFLMILGFITSCKDSEKSKMTKSTKSTTEKKSVKKVASSNSHKIVVIEKIPAGGYIYLKVLENDKKYWIAVPGRQIKIGATYYYDEGMEMKNFESKILKRTFDTVIFAQGVRDEENKTKNKINNRTVKKNINKRKTKVVNIEKAINGIRISELFENPKVYQNKEVIIKGEVVKVNNGIMGVNFIHLQDGTTGNGEYDITITTNEKVKVGDIITIKGTVILNKDFGAGYLFDVLIEKVSVL